MNHKIVFKMVKTTLVTLGLKKEKEVGGEKFSLK